jgi:hypothetical protein
MGSEAETSVYSSRFLAVAYAVASPLYDLIVWWGFIPLGGERTCRREFARWLYLRPGMRVASLCSGTGSMERAMLTEVPELAITGVDLGRGQIARARKKDRRARVTYILGDAARYGAAGCELRPRVDWAGSPRDAPFEPAGRAARGPKALCPGGAGARR